VILELKDKKSLVIGAGKSGIAAARLLARESADVILNDLSDLSHLGYLKDEGISIEGGGHSAAVFEGRELIVLSPGVPADSSPLLELLAGAIADGAEIISEIELGSRFVDAPVIAVAGTNGKSTTTTLIGHILERSGKKVFAGGNLGTPLCQFILDGDFADILVLEVSSFQLERIETFKPFISIMLNISPDHLDRYRSMDEYVAAKGNLFMNQDSGDYAVLNMDDELVSGISSGIRAKIVPFGGVTEHCGGVYLKGDSIVSEIDGHHAGISASLLDRIGRFNMDNVMAAFAAALLCEVPEDIIVSAIDGFKGLTHRMEYVGDICGVRFFDDSKATNVGALMKSLEGIEGKVILIAGGKDKGGSYEPLKDIVAEKVKELILIGEAAAKMKEVLGGKTRTTIAATMEDAVGHAWTLAGEGESVLLSPACSSFDMFKSYAERGDAFKDAVKSLASGIGGDEKEAAIAG